MINLIPVSIINNHVIITAVVMATIIAPMMIPVITAVYANCHNGCKSKPGRIISVSIRWIIRYISRRINILYDWCRLNNDGSCSRYIYRNRIVARITRVSGN